MDFFDFYNITLVDFGWFYVIFEVDVIEIKIGCNPCYKDNWVFLLFCLYHFWIRSIWWVDIKKFVR